MRNTKYLLLSVFIIILTPGYGQEILTLLRTDKQTGVQIERLNIDTFKAERITNDSINLKSFVEKDTVLNFYFEDFKTGKIIEAHGNTKSGFEKKIRNKKNNMLDNICTYYRFDNKGKLHRYWQMYENKNKIYSWSDGEYDSQEIKYAPSFEIGSEYSYNQNGEITNSITHTKPASLSIPEIYAYLKKEYKKHPNDSINTLCPKFKLRYPFNPDSVVLNIETGENHYSDWCHSDTCYYWWLVTSTKPVSISGEKKIYATLAILETDAIKDIFLSQYTESERSNSLQIIFENKNSKLPKVERLKTEIAETSRDIYQKEGGIDLSHFNMDSTINESSKQVNILQPRTTINYSYTNKKSGKNIYITGNTIDGFTKKDDSNIIEYFYGNGRFKGYEQFDPAYNTKKYSALGFTTQNPLEYACWFDANGVLIKQKNYLKESYKFSQSSVDKVIQDKLPEIVKQEWGIIFSGKEGENIISVNKNVVKDHGYWIIYIDKINGNGNRITITLDGNSGKVINKNLITNRVENYLSK